MTADELDDDVREGNLAADIMEFGRRLERLIPAGIDQNPSAQVRLPIDRMRHG